MFELLPVLKQRFFDLNGLPLAGGFLYSYLAGTTTPSATYEDPFGVVPNTNPVILDANGYANVYIGGGASNAYKFVLTDSLGNVQFTVDDVTGSGANVPSGWTKFAITDGESATALAGMTVDISVYSSLALNCEIIRGTTVNSFGQVLVQGVNGTGQVIKGMFYGSVNDGVTFTVTQVGTVVQLLAATSSGPGAGTIKLSGVLVPV